MYVNILCVLDSLSVCVGVCVCACVCGFVLGVYVMVCYVVIINHHSLCRRDTEVEATDDC